MITDYFLDTKEKIFVGIAPGVTASGFAVWNKSKQSLKLYTLPLWELSDCLRELHKTNDLTVIIESSRLNKKNNFHGAENKNIDSKIRNHQRCIDILEFTEYHGIKHEVKPIKRKVNHETFKQKTGYTKSTNSETRDAGMLVYCS